MKRRLLLFWFLILSFGVKAQLDAEHWFAPMFDRNSASSYYANSSRQYLFLSTNETTPFDVEIYSGNVLLTTIRNLSKGNPKEYAVAQRYIISRDFAELGKGNKGLYLKASKRFFANLRFSTVNHAEILTSKGQAGVGTKFYAVIPPQKHNADILNFMLGVLATEDNTIVKISGYDAGVRFTGIHPTPNQIEIKLNKGESYLLEGAAAEGRNKTGFIGAKIEANKPISVTNGNFNGQYTDNVHTTGTDIMMDQSVPVDRLGDEFTIIKGFGQIGSEMEGALIVATENNTQIYVNDETSPVATLNEGQYYIVPDSKFIHRGSGHYNLYVKSTKNIYLYQLLGGVATSNATGGFNYIPPLNCFLPTQVGEIGKINSMYGEGSRGDYYTVPTKLNFITMKGAVVNVEGYTLTAANGPFDVSGTTEWVSYSIPNVSGNINVTSTKSITAGISAGSGYVGYGGYFAGFSTAVAIKRTGDCLPNIRLEVDGEFDAYQWKKEGVNIPGATGKTYQPTIPGNYSVEVTRANCTQTTTQTLVLNCPEETTINTDVCGQKVEFTPSFSNSTQTIDLTTLTIETQPTKGSVSINATTGKITYTPDGGATGSDTFTFKFSGNDANFPDTEIVKVNLSLNELVTKNAVLTTCPQNGMGVFDLTSANIGNTNNYPVQYYTSYADAQSDTNPIANASSYSSGVAVVYAKVVSPNGCSSISEISLAFYDLPTVNVSHYNAEHCDDDFDGKIEIDFSRVSAQITDAKNSVKYYLNQTDAENNAANHLANHWSYTTATDVWARVVSENGCAVVEKISFGIKGRLALTTKSASVDLCDTDLDGVIKVNLEDYHSLFTPNSVVATYYATLADAKNQVNALSEINATDGQTYYLRFEDGISCSEIAELKFNIKVPQSSAMLKDVEICREDTTLLDAGTGFVTYAWSNGATTQSITVGVGDYWVDLTSANGCVYRQYVKVSAIEIPKIESIDIKEGMVTVTAVGGTTPYLYSLDGGAWQISNVFINVGKGKHTVGVRSQSGCEATYQDFVDIRLVNVITPNGDGINDVIDYSDLRYKSNAKFQIFDRYGALVFDGNSSNNFIWDGKAKGRPLPTATYWYLIEWQEPNTNTWVKTASWILLKNRD